MTVVAVPDADAQVQLLPVDDAATRPDFFSFRAQLQRDVARHDVNALLSVVAPDIKASFGGDDGIDDFRRMWRLGEADSRLWEELGAVLALGGTFSGPETFVAPYTFSRWPDALDAFEHVAVIGANVRLRAAPKADASTLRTVSFVVLPLARAAGVPGDEAWQAVQLGSGFAYIASRFVRSPIGYRATFMFRGRWQLVSFLAGD
jgi:hypothetical protein